MTTNLIRQAMHILTLLGLGVLILAGWMIYKNPQGEAGYITAAFAVLQLVISKIGEAVRISAGVSPDAALPPPPPIEGTE